jgi:hypothetical protein
MENKDDEILSFDTLDIRAVPVDRLAEEDERNIQSRLDRLQTWKDRGYKIVESLKDGHEKAQQNYLFVEQELEGAKLALLLKRGEKVRVECPDCGGTGLRPEDVTSGQYRTGNAFSAGSTSAHAKPPLPTDRQKCQRCEGKRWVIMTRFRG